jgi:hypothetical protein
MANARVLTRLRMKSLPSGGGTHTENDEQPCLIIRLHHVGHRSHAAAPAFIAPTAPAAPRDKPPAGPAADRPKVPYAWIAPTPPACLTPLPANTARNARRRQHEPARVRGRGQG